jgi:hypothetical protein
MILGKRGDYGAQPKGIAGSRGSEIDGRIGTIGPHQEHGLSVAESKPNNARSCRALHHVNFGVPRQGLNDLLIGIIVRLAPAIFIHETHGHMEPIDSFRSRGIQTS